MTFVSLKQSKSLRCSIIIPSYNGALILPKVFSALLSQTIPREEFEVILVDDGSMDDTRAVCAQFQDRLQIHYVYQDNQGQGNARNHGLEYAQAPVIVFLQADTIAAPDFLEQHLKVHDQYPASNIGCLGFTTWDPEVGITPLMYFMEHGGHQFAYEKAKKFPPYHGGLYPDVPYRFFYTSNLSLKRTLFAKEQFEPGFTKYGWEDIELGYRLWERHGFHLLYNEHARVLHHEFVSLDRWKQKTLSTARNGVFFEHMCPNVRLMPHGWKRLIFAGLAWAPHVVFWKVLHRIVPHKYTHFMYYYSLMKRLTFRGMREGRQELEQQLQAHAV